MGLELGFERRGYARHVDRAGVRITVEGEHLQHEYVHLVRVRVRVGVRVGLGLGLKLGLGFKLGSGLGLRLG